MNPALTYYIQTYSGASFYINENENMLVKSGIIKAKDLNIKNDTVAILPWIEEYLHNDTGVIFDISKFRNKASDLGIKESIIEKHIRELVNIGLLPLKLEDKRILILCRMLGYLQADGHLKIMENGLPRSTWVFGRPYDAEKFDDDLVELGLNRMAICEKIDKYKSSGITHHTWTIYRAGPLASLLAVLDGVLGRKTEQPANPIPEWIMNGSLAIKKEFVSGFMGGDGCKINTSTRHYESGNDGKTYDMSRITQHKLPEYVESSRNWFKQLTKLFNDLGINCGIIHTRPSKKTNKIKVEMEMPSDMNNLINYMDKIGYTYCTTKYMDSVKVSQWLKYRNFIIEYTKRLKIEVAELHSLKIRPKWTQQKLADRFGITKAQVGHYCQDVKNGIGTNMPTNGIMNFDKWLERVSVDEKFIYEPIKRIIPINYSDYLLFKDKIKYL